MALLPPLRLSPWVPPARAARVTIPSPAHPCCLRCSAAAVRVPASTPEPGGYACGGASVARRDAPGASLDGGCSDKSPLPTPDWEQRRGTGTGSGRGNGDEEETESGGTGGPTWCHRWERPLGVGRRSRDQQRPRLQPAK